MAPVFQSRDGEIIKDGSSVTLELAYDTASIKRKGVVRSFVDETGGIRWEILTDEPQWPAVGFLPENVLSADKG